MTSTVSNPVNSSLLPLDSFTEIWNWESKEIATKDIWQMYEVQCRLFFVVMGLKKNEWIDHSWFQKLWQQCVEWEFVIYL